MIWSIIRLIFARRMLYLSRWLLNVGEAIVDEETAKGSTAPVMSAMIPAERVLPVQ
ncbi:hypothetical protein [Rhizobium leguminosarum]|jgi:hypothetical protein|uniref:hypothetical protein n=1 Tax=Rhizobium leguminosarum TaxID=384 RepID=UPI0013EE5B45|nr:hypothetical protein [Rhizobium leguminosarum]